MIATIPVIVGDMTTVVAPGEYALVYLVFNTISNLPTQAELFVPAGRIFHELTELSERFKGVRNLNVAVREWEDQVVFLHRIAEGPEDLSQRGGRGFAERLTWQACAQTFLEHVTEGARAWREKKTRKERLKTLFANARQRRHSPAR